MCAIFETKKMGEGITPCQDYILSYSGVEKSERLLFIMLIHKNYRSVIPQIKYTSERVVRIQLKRYIQLIKKRYIYLVYIPEDCKSKADKDYFMRYYRDSWDSLIITRGINVRVGNHIIPTCYYKGVKESFIENM